MNAASMPQDRPRAGAPAPPRVAGAAVQRGRPRLFDPSTPQPFARVPDFAIGDPDLPDVPFRVLTALCRFLSDDGTRADCSVPELMLKTGKSEKVVRAALRELTSLGYIEWEEIDRRFRVHFVLYGKRPSLLARPTTHELTPMLAPDPEPSWEPERAETAPPIPPISSEKERKREKQASPAGLPTQDPLSPEGEPEPITDGEIIQQLISHALEVFQIVDPADVRAAVAKYTELAVEAVIDSYRGQQSRLVNFRYCLPRLEQWHREGVRIRPKATPAPPALSGPAVSHLPSVRRDAAEVALGLLRERGWDLRADGDKLHFVTFRDDAQPLTMGMRDRLIAVKPELLQLLAEAPSPRKNNPAAGPHANVPPPPVPGKRDDSSPPLYRVDKNTANGDAEKPRIQPAPRASNPPAPVASGDTAPPPSSGASAAMRVCHSIDKGGQHPCAADPRSVRAASVPTPESAGSDRRGQAVFTPPVSMAGRPVAKACEVDPEPRTNHATAPGGGRCGEPGVRASPAIPPAVAPGGGQPARADPRGVTGMDDRRRSR